jgi:dTDP-4-amino-4,6-dideoxygalactose transaminase
VIQLNDFKQQWQVIRTQVFEAVERVGNSGFFILGKEVAAFEAKLAEFAGFKYAIGVASGQDALEISLRCLEIGAGRRVLTTPLSAFASTLAILRVGAVPVFCDTDGYGLLDLDHCHEILSTCKDDVACVLPVNLYGHSINQHTLHQIHNRFSMPIIEDCAQSIGAKWKGEMVGVKSDMAATSFYPTKNLGALGDGGAIFTQSDVLADQARSLRNYGQRSLYVHDDLGMNSRLDELHAAILCDAMMPNLLQWEERRSAIARRYCCEIDNPKIHIPGAPTGSESVWHLFPILVGERDAFRKYLLSKGIQTGAHYPKLIPEQRALLQYGNYKIIGSLENAQRYALQEVSLPIHPFLCDDAVAQVIAGCNHWKGI